MDKVTPPEGARHQNTSDQAAREAQGSAFNRDVAFRNVPPDGVHSSEDARRLGTDLWRVSGGNDTPWPTENVTPLDAAPLVSLPEPYKTFSQLYVLINEDEPEKLPAFEALLQSNRDSSLYTLTEEQVGIRGRRHYNEPLLFRSVRQNKYRYAISLYTHCPVHTRQAMLNASAVGGFYFLSVLFLNATSTDHYDQIKHLLNTIDAIPENAFTPTMKNNSFLHFMDYRFLSCGEIFSIIYHKSNKHNALRTLSTQRNHDNNTPLLFAVKRGNKAIIVLFLYHLLKTTTFEQVSTPLLAAMKQAKSQISLAPISQNSVLKQELDCLLAKLAKTNSDQEWFKIEDIIASTEDESLTDTQDVMLLPEDLQFEPTNP